MLHQGLYKLSNKVYNIIAFGYTHPFLLFAFMQGRHSFDGTVFFFFIDNFFRLFYNRNRRFRIP